MKTNRPLIFFLCLAIGYLLGCLSNCKGDTVVTPEVKGTLHDTIKVVQTQFVPKEKIVVKNVPYEVVKTDTLHIEGRTIYIEPIDTLQTQQFSKKYEDEHLQLTMSGIVTGKINDIKADYTIKPKEVKVPKQSRIGIGISIGVGVDGKPYAGAGINYNIIKL